MRAIAERRRLERSIEAAEEERARSALTLTQTPTLTLTLALTGERVELH